MKAIAVIQLDLTPSCADGVLGDSERDRDFARSVAVCAVMHSLNTTFPYSSDGNAIQDPLVVIRNGCATVQVDGDDDKIDLTKIPSYTGNYKRLEVQAHEPDIHDEPGLYMQVVDGCGYDVYPLTPDEAEKIGLALLRAAAHTRRAFYEQTTKASA